jgi:hypothetical protein
MSGSHGVTFTRCPECGAVAWPDWPMRHRPRCPQIDIPTSTGEAR